MTVHVIVFVLLVVMISSGGLYLCCRRMVLFNDRAVKAPAGDNIVSPADGRIQFVRQIAPGQRSAGTPALPESVFDHGSGSDRSLVLIGIRMAFFGARYHRAPICGAVDAVFDWPHGDGKTARVAVHPGRAANASGNGSNGRRHPQRVTRITGTVKASRLICHLIQNAAPGGGNLHSFVIKGSRLEKGAIFALSRTPARIDLIIPWLDGMELKAARGAKVRAGKTILVA